MERTKYPKISVSSDYYNFGDVSQAKGEVSTLFEIANTGNADLIISKLDTSCGCTFASIIFEGKESPRFTMSMRNAGNSKDWQMVIPAGKKAQVKVYYNPNVHADFRGTAVREVYVFSNDPLSFKTKIEIELNQIN